MNAFKLAAAGAALGVVASLVALSLTGAASADSPSLRVTSDTVPPGAEGSVQLIAEVDEPGLGAWTIDIEYDNSVAPAVDCQPENGSICNHQYGPNVVRVTGATANGLVGETVLATIFFRCGPSTGDSSLRPVVQVFADATLGEPQPIDAERTGGSFICKEPTPTPEPSDTPPPEPTATPVPALPDAGTGPGGIDSGKPVSWLIAGLTGAGLAWLVAALASRRYAPQPAGPGAAPLRAAAPVERAPRAPRTTIARWLAAARDELRARGLDDLEPPWRR